MSYPTPSSYPAPNHELESTQRDSRLATLSRVGGFLCLLGLLLPTTLTNWVANPIVGLVAAVDFVKSYGSAINLEPTLWIHLVVAVLVVVALVLGMIAGFVGAKRGQPSSYRIFLGVVLILLGLLGLASILLTAVRNPLFDPISPAHMAMVVAGVVMIMSGVRRRS